MMYGKYPRGKKKKRRFKRRIRRSSPLFFLICALVMAGIVGIVYGAVFGIRLMVDVFPYQDTFLPYVTVNGQSLTGMTQQEAVQYFDEFYAESLNHQVVITYEGQQWSFAPVDVQAHVDVSEQVEAAWQYGKDGSWLEKQREIRALRENPVDLPLTLSYNEEALDAFVSSIEQTVDKEPVNATISIDGSEKPQVTASETGLDLDAELLKQQLTQVILNGTGEEIVLSPAVVQPEVNTMDVSQEFVLLAECTTSLKGSSSARNSNIALALSRFNGLVLESGEQISFNDLVGNRTAENGFKEANEYDGTTVVTGVGGGVCQASTTLYGAILRVPLQIDERHSHKMSVGYVAASQDAAVSYPDKDLVFTNTIGETLYFFTSVDTKKDEATVKIYGKALNVNYFVNIRSEVIEMDIKSDSVVYRDDVEGEKAWYTDQKVLYKVGKTGMRSRAYRQYIHILTGEVIHEELLSEDYYQPESDIYLRGVHER